MYCLSDSCTFTFFDDDVSDMNEVSDEALDRLEKVLSKHYKTVTEMLSVIRRDDNGNCENF